jgi:PA domain
VKYVPVPCDLVVEDLTGKIALVDLKSVPMCMIDVKAANVHQAGAVGMIIINNVDNYISPGLDFLIYFVCSLF